MILSTNEQAKWMLASGGARCKDQSDFIGSIRYHVIRKSHSFHDPVTTGHLLLLGPP